MRYAFGQTLRRFRGNFPWFFFWVCLFFFLSLPSWTAKLWPKGGFGKNINHIWSEHNRKHTSHRIIEKEPIISLEMHSTSFLCVNTLKKVPPGRARAQKQAFGDSRKRSSITGLRAGQKIMWRHRGMGQLILCEGLYAFIHLLECCQILLKLRNATAGSNRVCDPGWDGSTTIHSTQNIIQQLNHINFDLI